MNKETLLNVIRNREKYLPKTLLDDNLDYLITGEGPWFTNSQFGGHVYLDGDLTKFDIIGELENSDRILFDSVSLKEHFTSEHFGDNPNEEIDWQIPHLGKISPMGIYQEIEKWFNKNQIDNIIYYGSDYSSIKEYNDDSGSGIEFIFYKENDDIHCVTIANVEHFIRWNEENNDNFNNALALKR